MFLRAALVGAVWTTSRSFAAHHERPNIIFIMSDDHTSQAVGVYGGRLAKLNPTPTIDRLAREGMRFDNVFCTNSICTPSRANIMTGQHCQTNGVLDLGGSLEPKRQYLPIEMKKAGYTTAMIGKWHLKLEPGAFDYYCVLPGQGKYHDPDFRVRGSNPWPKNTIHRKGHSSDVITDLTLDWLEKRDKTKPFFLMHHYKAPHDMFDNAKRYDSYLEDVEIPEPDNLYDQPAKGFGSVATRGKDDDLIHVIGSSVSKRMTRRNMGKHMKVDQNLSDRDYTHQSYQRYLKRYLRCVKGVDDNLKRLFDYLRRNDLMDNTVILYTGDQGFYLGEHDYIDKRWMYEEGMRMPFIVRYPKMVKAGSSNSWLINNTDFAATMLELAGAKVPSYMQGHSFAGALRGEAKPTNWRKATYYRYWMHMAHNHNNPAHFGIRRERYKLIFFYGCDFTGPKGNRDQSNRDGNRYYRNTPPAWEFYDLKNDPHEMQNQYSNKKYKRIITAMKKQLKQIRRDLNETDEKYPHIQKIIDAHWEG
ncbi:MAG: sulfatase [Planctomycetes bacterium]|nr:sulfatase [Planctomycetota bacterium]